MTPCSMFDMVVFGGAGDLSTRKLLPALYYLNRSGQISGDSRIIGTGRGALSDQDFRDHARAACGRYVRDADLDANALDAFTARLHYAQVSAREPEQFANLAAVLGNAEPKRCRVYFLATAPSLFADIAENLAHARLNTPQSRVVLEKPLGTDLGSAQAINQAVGAVFSEQQIFRIDHYLGKETVQNLMALRFANTLFEPLWQRTHIRDVQITLAERVGVEGRADYYEKTGAMRDMVQNHLLQLLCITAMEPPTDATPDAVRDEKLKVLRALRPMRGKRALRNTVRGQYRAGAIDGVAVPGYQDEDGIEAGSQTETFAVIRAQIDSWRWAGVPFYLRTGKRLAEKRAEIVINFREVPLNIFGTGSVPANRLVIRLQPDEGVTLSVLAKQPGPDVKLRPVALNLDFAETFRVRPLDAYERLITDVIRGNLTLFMRNDELEAAWAWCDPILQAWAEDNERPKPYQAGGWGPSSSVSLLAREDAAWHEEVSDDG